MGTLPANASTLLWEKNGTLWSNGKYGDTVTGFLGWLDVAFTMRERISELNDFVADVKKAGFERVILAGMGGSSLAPLVLQKTLEDKSKGLPLSVLDSTDPATVMNIANAGDLSKTLVLISSKSGSTAEPNAFCDYLYSRIKEVIGEKVGDNFVAITDPGSPFESRAKELRFRKIFLNYADIGGRYSALSNFGLVPAALMGIDVSKLLERAISVCEANKSGISNSAAPAIALGAYLGQLETAGRDKLTFILPEDLNVVGLWMEQLIAESTGKEGKGILPIAGEILGSPDVYGSDRVFAYIRPVGKNEPLDSKIDDLRSKGHPVIDIHLNDLYDIGGQMMHWEIATAIAGAVIEINPFDQPNVQESKDITKKYVKSLEDNGSLPEEIPTCKVKDQAAYGGRGSTIEECLQSFLGALHHGDYVCLQAYLTESPELNLALENLQKVIRDRFRCATTNGYGPRFLHSTGQFHKGGPNSGHFIQLTQIDQMDTLLPEKAYTFGAFRNAQCRGDKDALLAHGRRVIHLELGHDVIGGVNQLAHAISEQ